MGEGRKRDYKDFSLRMSSSLFNEVGVVETSLRVFLSIGSLTISVGNEGIYSRV